MSAAGLAQSFLRRFPRRDRAGRSLGREAEFPIVHPDGSAADISALWRRLSARPGGRFDYEEGRAVALSFPDVIYAAEVGRGTMEVIVGPVGTLAELDGAMERGVEPLVAACEAEGLRVLGYGVQPVTPPSASWMTPKPRYRVLHEVIGDDWLSFAVTAADQVHVDITADEIVPVTNLLNLLAPVVVALCANSPVVGGRASGVSAWRCAAMGRIGQDVGRHGMPEGPVQDLAGWIGRTLPMPYLMDRRDGAPVAAGERFDTWLARAALDDEQAWDKWLLHEHYIWNAARPRAAHGTVEVRGACQQPWAEHGAVGALSAGLVEGHLEIADWVSACLGPEAWPAMRRWHDSAVIQGAAAPEPVSGLVDGILDRAEAALERRGERGALDPLRRRWQTRRSPAHRAVELWENGGARALVEGLAVR